MLRNLRNVERSTIIPSNDFHHALNRAKSEL